MRLRSLLATLSLLTACGADTTAPVIETATFSPSLGVNLAGSTKTASGLYYRDITVGTGAALSSGKTVGVAYTGSFIDGATFDSRPVTNPYTFVLGTGTVIKGWDEGLVGMKVGGKRQLIIPPALAYGEAGRLSIPGNTILVFTVDAVSAQ